MNEEMKQTPETARIWPAPMDNPVLMLAHGGL